MTSILLQIVLKKWYLIYKDHVSLEDYGEQCETDIRRLNILNTEPAYSLEIKDGMRYVKSPRFFR